jgi:diacylglycerol kinase (CTP)
MTHPASLSSANTKGVKNITRKVIKRLEGLGHLEMVDLTVSEEEEEPEKLSGNGAGEDSEVERLLYAFGKEANGIAKQESTKVKPNLEIPRKVLHASIGLFSSSILVVSRLTFLTQGSLLYTFIYRRAMCVLSF